ncbi:MAG TPA: malonic semialdehyde reductase [Rhodocyclaceae bacterium]|nr:malonic semialdehyde reductase [Rhodocyclaceae bacterium]
MPQRLPDAALDQLFRTARSHNGWQSKPVTDALLRELYETLVWGPTSANGCPARFVFLRTDEQKQRLAPALKGHNQAKALNTPVVALVAYDRHFYERLPELFPIYDAAAPYRGNQALADQVALVNGSLQGAYLILAARALGLDCGPISGMDVEQVNQLFFPDGRWAVNFVCCLGYGDAEKLRPRGPRPSFDDACVLL